MNLGGIFKHFQMSMSDTAADFFGICLNKTALMM